ncbi:hypothetical protein Tco_1144783 [Tanacetum coccineum]
MYEAMITLSDPQKKCLKDMGFERMNHFPIVELPSALAYHAIDHFHTGIMELRLEKGSIKATRQKVQDMLGIPMGRRKLEDLEERPSNDPFIKDTMGTLDNGGRVSMKLLKRITEDVDISDIDWCGYILDCLQTSKKNWKDKEEIKLAPLWVKLHHVPIMAYLEVGLSLIATQLGRPIMMDSYTSNMCVSSWGRSTYAHILIEILAEKKLLESMVITILMSNEKGHSLATVEIEYEWKPPRCFTCVIFDHVTEKCPKNPIVEVEPKMNDGDGFVEVEKGENSKTSTNDNSKPKEQVEVKNSFSSLGDEDTDWEVEGSKLNVINESDSEDIDADHGGMIKLTMACMVIQPSVALWNSLGLHKHYVRDRPWCILGDFNAALFLHDSSAGNSNIDISMREFKECVEDIEVMDVQNSGLQFTWSQKPKGSSGLLKKIDRIMANLKFNDIFAGAHTIFKPYRISDHAPSILNIPTKLKNLKKPLRKLLYEKGNLHNNVNKLRDDLDCVQTRLDNDPFNEAIRQEEATVLAAFNDACLMEDRFLKKKAKIDWLREGDSNSAYFHKACKSRVSRSRIDVVTNGDGVVFENDKVDDVFVSHYEAFLGQPGYTHGFNDIDLFRVKLDENVALDMTRAVTTQEVKSVLFSMGNDKSPGPDGFTVAFFKESWDIVSNDFVAAVGEFFTNSKILKELNHTIIALIPKVKSPTRVNDYRPISSYPFVPGRSIADNVLLTQELMHNYHLDHGLPSINGSLHGLFKGKCGLRQGDPLFPYLFTLIMEILTLMLQRGVRSSYSFTYHRYCLNMELINLCFAEDLFLFANGDVDSVRVIKDALFKFKEASGLVPSLPKTEEEDAIRKSNEKTTKKKIKEAKREATKKLAKKKQPEKDREENVSDNEEYDDQSDDVANKEKTDEEAAKRKAELLAELKAIETILEKKAKDAAENEDEANNEEDADNNEENADNEEDAENNEEDDENEEDADNNEEDDDNEEDADNEDQADNEENVDQVFRNIKMLPFLNAAKRSKKKEDGKVEEKQQNQRRKKRKIEISESEQPNKKKSNRQKSTYKGTMKKSGSKKNPIIEESPKRFTRGDAKRQAELENVNPQNEAEDDEDVKSISSDDVIVETKKKGRKSKGKKEGEKMKKAEEETQVESEEDVLYDGSNSDDERLPVGKEKKKKKRTKKAKSSTSRSYLIKQSKNDIEGGENNETEEEEEDRKLTKDKMHKGLESESEGDEQLEKVTIPKKGKGSKAEKPYPTCNTRLSPKPVYKAMMTLSDPQKKCLKDMGFERMIHFPIVELPSALAYHAIDHFHTGSMELRLEKGSIKATRQKVQDMLGIPMGSKKLEDLEERPSNDPFIKEWEKQFKHVQKPTPAAIASVISDTTEADFMFRMNFITLFGSTMGTLDNGGRVSTKLLKRITEDVDISDIDWCGYILDCLQTSKKNWKDVKTRKNFYYGPLTFLCLLYLDSTIFLDLLVLRHRPALRSWNTTTMRKMIKMETETRRLGKLEHHKEFDLEEEQDGMNVYKELDVYVAPINDKEPETKEEYYEKIVLKFDIISDERSELVRTLRNAVKKFEDDQMMIDFCKQYGELFNDNEFNLFESSKDNDSEGEPDGDNENNNHDDDGAPTADANKKKEKGGSDGKEENMNGDEREVTAQMDVNNQIKELNKEKDANETKDNDKMNNNDMKNDSVQEKQDTDKDENAKVDKVKEKQGDDKDEIGEDEFWKTQFTDSQCERDENQAKEEIKKKKTAKRSSLKEISPYQSLLVCRLKEVNRLDLLTKRRNANTSGYMQTLAPTLKIESNVIDTYCLVLNHEQGVNSKRKKTKHFFYTGMIVKKHVSMHHSESAASRAQEVLNKKPTILRPKWGTEENNTDCGVFLMMHMENYNEENARNWNLEFPTKEEGNRYDIIKMRMRFATKMLSHEINIHREEMSKQALEFADRNKEKKARKALIREAIRVKKEKQESERVQSVI